MRDNPRHRIAISAMLILAATFACGAATAAAPANVQLCGELRDRPGNDDIFVYMDTSLSMGQPHSNLLRRAKAQLEAFCACYLKPGDLVIIGTFDSETRIETSKEIRGEGELAQDMELLVEEIDALHPTPKRYYECLSWSDERPRRCVRRGARTSPGRRRVVGGGEHTDIGVLLQTIPKHVAAFGRPSSRKLVLVFTDGVHDPPVYSPFHGEDVSLRIMDGALDVTATRVALVGMVTEGDPAGEDIRHNLERLLGSFDAEVVGKLEELTIDLIHALQNRIDLLPDYTSTPLDLGTSDGIVLDEELRVVNRTADDKAIGIRTAVLTIGGRELTLDVEPAQFSVAPRSQTALRVRGAFDGVAPGSHRGTVTFEPATGVFFAPTRFQVVVDVEPPRVRLDAPETLDLEDARSVRLDERVRVVNDTPFERRVEVSEAVLSWEDGSAPIAVEPATLTVAPHADAWLHVTGDVPTERPGRYTRAIEFGTTGGATLRPNTVPLRWDIPTWWQAYGAWVTWALVVLLCVSLVLGAAIYVRWKRARRPIPVHMTWLGEDGAQATSDPVTMRVGDVKSFGGTAATLAVYELTGTLGKLRRSGPDRWAVEVPRDGDGMQDETREYRLGSPLPLPGRGTFRFRRKLDVTPRPAGAARPTAPPELESPGVAQSAPAAGDPFDTGGW